MKKKILAWWRKLLMPKCDYCKQKVEVWYEAYMFPVKKYKGMKICKDCIHTESVLGPNEEIIEV